MADVALNNAANAMTQLANALTPGGEKTLMKINFFTGDGTQDPVEWLEEFEQAAIANNWTAARQLALASAYLKEIASAWFQGLNPAPNAFKDGAHQDQSFYHLFKIQFSTTKQKIKWQKQFFKSNKEQTLWMPI